jgi:hypothetical protein
MTAAGIITSQATHASFVRLGGLAGLLMVLMALTLNFALTPTPYPAFDAPIDEIAAYVDEHAGVLAVANALRWVVFVLLPFFAVGFYRFASGQDDGPHRSWAMVGVLAAVWIPAVGTVANSIEVAGIWKVDEVAQQPQLLMACWVISSAIFITVQAAWGMLALAFSVAGWLAEVIPGWLAGLGAVTFVTCISGTVGVMSVLDGGWAEAPAFASYGLFPLWLTITSVHMVRRTWSK